MKKELQQLIAQGKTDQALGRLLALSEQRGYEDLREEVLLQSARYREYTKGKRQGTSDAQEQQIALARINHALVQIINQLPEDIPEEVSEGVLSTISKPRKIAPWQWVVGIGVIISILAGIAEITGFDLKSLIGITKQEPALQLTVYVHGPEGKQDIVLENQGQLILDLRNDRRVAQVGEYGRTNFGEIGRTFLGKAVPLSIQAKGYVMAHPDSSYIFEGDPIYLEVKSKCRFCELSGTIQNHEGQLLPGLVVMLKGTGRVDTTGQNGQFLIQVPPEQEREEYILSVIREGRILWENYVTPSPLSPIEILLPQ